MTEYDAVIVGAGPAGGSCARELAQRGRSVLLLERSRVIGEPDFSSAATPNETLEAFSLPESVTDAPWSSALFATRSERSELASDHRLGWVLSYKRLKQHLAREAEASGAEIRSGSGVTTLLRAGDRVCGVRYRTEGVERAARARVVIDASGGRSPLAKELGFASRQTRALALEVHMESVALEREGRLEFYLGPCFVPRGYAWVFPMGAGRAKVGLATFTSSSAPPQLRPLLDRFARENPQIAGGRVIDVHGGAAVASGGIRAHTRDGFLVIGDAAGQINPLAGEGVRHALFSGRFAAETVHTALDAPRVDRHALGRYDHLWRRYVGTAWRRAFWVQCLLRRITLSDRASDHLVKALGRLSTDEVYRICFYYDFGLLRLRTLGRILISFLPRFGSSAARSVDTSCR